jgi:hypothetical protein
VVPKARPMPLQSFAQRTVSLLPHGIRRSLLKLARPEFANDFTATTEVEARRRRRLLRHGWLAFAATLLALLVWIESGLGVSYRDNIAGSRGPLCFWFGPKALPSALDSSLGVHQRSPLRQYRCRESSPGRAEARPSARSCQTPDAFRPCRSSRLRRFTPLDTLQVYCTLHPAMGFAKFPVCYLPFARRRGAGGSPSPVALYPSECSPPLQAGARHRAPVPSRRCSGFLVVGPPVLPRLAPRPSACRPTSGSCSAAKSVASPPALPPTNCPILPWAWSHAGSDALPPPLRGVAGGWPPTAPRDRGGLARDSGTSPSRRGGSDPRPMHGLVGPRPRGASVRCVRRSGGPRGVRPCRRLAGHPGVAAPPAPRLGAPEGVPPRGSGALGGTRGCRP